MTCKLSGSVGYDGRKQPVPANWRLLRVAKDTTVAFPLWPNTIPCGIIVVLGRSASSINCNRFAPLPSSHQNSIQPSKLWQTLSENDYQVDIHLFIDGTICQLISIQFNPQKETIKGSGFRTLSEEVLNQPACRLPRRQKRTVSL